MSAFSLAVTRLQLAKRALLGSPIQAANFCHSASGD